MKSFLLFLSALSLVAVSVEARAEDIPPCPPEYEICLTKDKYEKVVRAVEELDSIKKAEAEIVFKEPVVIVRDWEDRVYVNGGEKNPIKATVKVGPAISRDMSLVLPTRVTFRPEPPEPQFAFRARVRASFGIMIPEIVKTAKEGELHDFWAAGLDLDFVKIDLFNINVHVGSAGFGGGVGVDITKNFGVGINALCNWGEWTPTASMGVYFALN